eukprot:Awhi_evm2s10989
MYKILFSFGLGLEFAVSKSIDVEGIDKTPNLYAPVEGTCFEDHAIQKVSLRAMNDLGEKETEWLSGRKSKTDAAWKNYLTSVDLEGINTNALDFDTFPRVALAGSANQNPEISRWVKENININTSLFYPGKNDAQ